MTKPLLLILILLACSDLSWAIYGPSLTRTDTATMLRACEEAKFSNAGAISEALKTGDPARIPSVLGPALEELRSTSFMSDLNAARNFCIHELVPSQLPREGEIASKQALQPTVLVEQFRKLGIEYFYYDPDAVWMLKEDPVDLTVLATSYLDSPWGRLAFLMMTRLGWSHGACQEGPDQFREVINQSEPFLVDYPNTEVSDEVRLELAKAYATWWYASRIERNPPNDDPEKYKVGANEAKQRAIELYQENLRTQKKSDPDVEKRLKALIENPNETGQMDYFCDDYED